MGFRHRLAVASCLFLTATLPTGAQADCVEEHWAGYIAPGPQEADLIERITVSGGEVLAFRLSPFIGDFAKLYILLLDDGTCFTKAALVGSYAFTQDYHAERQQAEGKPVTRLYHADLYDGANHATLGFFEGDPPDYKEIKPMLLEALK